MTGLLMKAALATSAAWLLAAPAAALPADFKEKADAYLDSAYPDDGPGAAVIVVDDGEVVYAAGQGLADVAAGRRMTPDAVFRLGSITKQFTAAVVLQLAQEGKLSLDDPVSKYFPDFSKPAGDATIAQLLSHTSGMADLTKIPRWIIENRTRSFTTEQLLAEFKHLPADFAPGTRHQYNNGGYILLGAIVEKVTGKPWYESIEERIAGPLALETIRFGGAGPVPETAVGYTEKGGKQVPQTLTDMSLPHAAGGLVGSVEDMARWALALHHGKVLSPQSYARMIAPTKLPGGKTADYGFGLRVDHFRGHPIIGHGGAIAGYETSSVYFPQEDVFVAVFANSDDPAVDPDVPMIRLAALAVGESIPHFRKAAVPETEIAPLLGVYAYDGGERRFFMKDGRLFTRLTGRSDHEVFPAGGDRFFYGQGTLSWFEVERDPSGKHVMKMFQGGSAKPFLSVRSGPVPADAGPVKVERAVLERYVGTYRAPPGTATVAIDPEGRLTVQIGDGKPQRMIARSATEFTVEGGGPTVVFHGGEQGISHFTVDLGGRLVRAERQPDGG